MTRPIADAQRRSAAERRERAPASVSREPSRLVELEELRDEEHDAADRRRPRERQRPRGDDEVGMTAGQAGEPGLTVSTPTNQHSGRWNSHISAGPMIASAGREPGSCHVRFDAPCQSSAIK